MPLQLCFLFYSCCYFVFIEIKSVKQRLKKQKELEGIDLGNVINEPRGTRSRRASYVVPKYNLSDESESEDEEDLSEGEEDGKKSFFFNVSIGFFFCKSYGFLRFLNAEVTSEEE